MPDKPHPDDIPTFEEIQRDLGLDAMSMFHSMVSPNDPQEHGDEERTK